jgi:hypothetical protein
MNLGSPMPPHPAPPYDRDGRERPYDRNGHAPSYDRSDEASLYDRSDEASLYDRSDEAPSYDRSDEAPSYDRSDEASPYDRSDEAFRYDRNGQAASYGRVGDAPSYDRDGLAPSRRDPGFATASDGGLDAERTAPAGPERDDRTMTSPVREVDDRRAARPDQDGDTGGATPAASRIDVEPAVPAGQQIRDSIARGISAVRRSIPLRTVLFLLPPLALPALAFDLSVVATLLVALTLLWLAAASAVFCMMMLEGNQQLALRSIEHRLDRMSAGTGDGGAGDDDLQEALLAIGAQLDTLSDAVTALSERTEGSPADDQPEILSHRPQEHWPASPGDEHYDRYGQTAVPDTNWSESRWRR